MCASAAHGPTRVTSPIRIGRPPPPPKGFNGVLSRQQWKGVIDFAKAVDAAIVTSFATSVGTRDAKGVWTPEQARRFLTYTTSVGGRIAAAEFMNEPTFAAMGGAPPDYDAAAYGRDFKVFHAFAKAAAPDMLILGPGSVGETTVAWGVGYGSTAMLHTRDLLAASGPGIDAFSYHHYGAVSQRCAPMIADDRGRGALGGVARAHRSDASFYRKLRDEFEPGKPFWLTETADAACGGNPWGGTFLDTFRYLDQLGRLAKQDVRVVMHNTLVASDYGLLDEKNADTRSPTTGRRCCGANSWAPRCSNRACRSRRVCMSMRSACAALPEAWRCWRSTRTSPLHGRSRSHSRQSTTRCLRLHSTARTWY